MFQLVIVDNTKDS